MSNIWYLIYQAQFFENKVEALKLGVAIIIKKYLHCAMEVVKG